jgi:prepilin peptidase CpaA
MGRSPRPIKRMPIMDATALGQLMAIAILPPLALLAAASDVAHLKIPNAVTAALALLFFPAALAGSISVSAIAVHLAAGLGALVLGFLFFTRNWVGAGDAKLFAALALWMGWPGTVEFALITALMGGALTLALLFARKAVGFVPSARLLNAIERRTKHIPYGVALAGGALVTYPQTELFFALAR